MSARCWARSSRSWATSVSLRRAAAMGEQPERTGDTAHRSLATTGLWILTGGVGKESDVACCGEVIGEVVGGAGGQVLADGCAWGGQEGADDLVDGHAEVGGIAAAVGVV